MLGNSPLASVCANATVDRLLSLARIRAAAQTALLVVVIMEFVRPRTRASREAIRCRGFDEELPYRGECGGTPSSLQQNYTTTHR